MESKNKETEYLHGWLVTQSFDFFVNSTASVSNRMAD